MRDSVPLRIWLSRWFEWSISDAGAPLLLLPIFLLVHRKAISFEQVRKHALEFAITLLAVVATIVYFLTRSTALPAAEAGACFFILLPLLWLAVRFSVRIAYPVFALVVSFVVAATLLGYGPYSGVNRGGTFTIFAQMVIAFGIAVLLLGAISEEQRDGQRALRRLNRDLEKIVDQRTSELQASKLQLEKVAFHDPLTGLPNRRLLEQRFCEFRSAASRRAGQLALLLIDLDWFKRVNDDFGHDAGDIVLVESARRLSSVVREYDLVARMGGDEFALLLPDVRDPHVIDSICRRTVARLSEQFLYQQNAIRISPSIGVAMYPANGESWPLLYKAADEALYSAKREGRAGWVWCRRPPQSLQHADPRL